MVLIKILNFIGRSSCHQNNVFCNGNLCMPMCSRCTGIYIGFLFSTLFFFFLLKKNKARIISNRLLLLFVSILLMGFDAAAAGFGIYECSNILRLITGFMVGWFLPLVFFPLKNSVVFKNLLDDFYLKNRKKFILWIVLLIFSILLFIFSYKALILVWSFLSLTGLIIFTDYIILILFFSIFKKFRNTIMDYKKYLLILFIAALPSIAILSLLSFLRKIIT